MRNIYDLENNHWVNHVTKNVETSSNQNIASFRCVKRELGSIISSLRIYNQSNSNVRYSKEIIDAFEFPIIYQFQLLLENITVSNNCTIDGSKLDPFFEVIQSPEFGGNVTASVLNAIDEFIAHGVIQIKDSNKQIIVNKIINSILNCKFTASHLESDEIALQKLCNLLMKIVSSEFGEYVSSDNLLKSVLKCFQISRQPRSSLLLKSFGEQSIKKLIGSIFSEQGTLRNTDSSNSSLVFIKIFNFLSTLSFFGLQNINKGGVPKSTFLADSANEYNYKMIKKMVQMDGIDSTTYQEIRKMGLELINIAIESGGKRLVQFPEIIRLIKDELCLNILIFSLRETSMLQNSLKCMLNIFLNFRSHMKIQFEFFLTTIQIRLANCGENSLDLLPSNAPNVFTSQENRELALNSLLEVSKDSQFLSEIFQNYDCDLYNGNVFRAIVRTFANQFVIENNRFNKKSQSLKAFTLFQRLGLTGLLNILRAVTQITQRQLAPEYGQVTGEIKSGAGVSLNSNLLKKKDYKRKILDCSQKFNSDPNNILDKIKATRLFGHEEVTPVDFAKFLRFSHNIDLFTLGEYLSKNREWNNQVRSAFLSTFNFNKKTIVRSLRELLATFKLPGESQQIERIMESFSHEYFIQQDVSDRYIDELNSGDKKNIPRLIYILEPESNEKLTIELDNSDTVFILSYSIIMLNTDLHNTQVKHKMGIDDFIKNNRGINNGKDLPKEFLTNIFETIKNDEIKLFGVVNHIHKSNNRNNEVGFSTWSCWVNKYFIERYPIDFVTYEADEIESLDQLSEEMLKVLLEMGIIDCIFTSIESSNDFQTLFNCIYGILQLVFLSYVFSDNLVTNEILTRISRLINSDLTAKSQLLLPIFIHATKITLNQWNMDSPWGTLIEIIFLLNSIQLIPRSSLEFEELTDNQGKVLSNYSNVQYPKLCFFPRTKTFGLSHGFEYLFEIVNNIKTGASENMDKMGIIRKLRIDDYPTLLLKSSRPLPVSNNHWLSDITNILFKSIEEEEEDSSRFISEPSNIVESVVQFLLEEDIKYTNNSSKNMITPSEFVLSWILNGSSPYLSLSIYALVKNLIEWENYFRKRDSLSSSVDFSLVNDNLPSISGNSWEMLSHLLLNSFNLCKILHDGIEKMNYNDYEPLIIKLKYLTETYPFNEKQHSNLESFNVNSTNVQLPSQSLDTGILQDKEIYSDWGPLLLIDKHKLINFRRISDPLCSIGMLMSIISIQMIETQKFVKKQQFCLSNKGLQNNHFIWREIFRFFLENVKRYSIFGFTNKTLDHINSERMHLKTQNNTETPRSLSRSEFMFAERIITNSLLILIKLFETQDMEITSEIDSLLEAFLQLHPIIFSLHSERVVAALQIIMRPKNIATESNEASLKESYDSKLNFPTDRCILLMLGILQRMVYIPSVSMLERHSMISPEFYPGKLSDPQILVLTSLECLGIWLYNPKYSSVLYNNISLIIQTLVTFAIFTPTTFNGSVVFSPIETEAGKDYNYDANLQAISLIFSLVSLFTNFESKVLIPQVVHTLCIAASFGPNVVRNHTLNRIQQTLGSIHVSSSWFISSPLIWINLIETSFLPLITFDFKFPYNSETGRISNDDTSTLLDQQFKNKTAKYILGEESVYKRQVHSVAIVSKIVLTRMDLLLEPLSISCEHFSFQLDNCSCETSNASFLPLVPVLVNLIEVLIENSTGSSSVFFYETIKNIVLVVLSTKISASFDELLLNPIKYYRRLDNIEMENKLSRLIENLTEADISGIVLSIINNIINSALPDVAAELSVVVESLRKSENSNVDDTCHSCEN
ncbi:SEC7 domain-containing protein [Cryptosporidium felis]|nr:SEC7 domain-containing protein [Cryptosporidium felis]